MSELKEVLEKELDLLRQTRDELRVKLHLAKADARDEWDKVEAQWHAVEDELRRLREHSKKPLAEINEAARGLVDELKRGYERVRSRL